MTPPLTDAERAALRFAISELSQCSKASGGGPCVYCSGHIEGLRGILDRLVMRERADLSDLSPPVSNDDLLTMGKRMIGGDTAQMIDWAVDTSGPNSPGAIYWGQEFAAQRQMEETKHSMRLRSNPKGMCSDSLVTDGI